MVGHLQPSTRPVVVITGAGGMGTAIALRLGSGKQILLADHSTSQLQTASAILEASGHIVSTHQVDVSSPDSVAELARAALNSGGRIEAVIHTAGLSPIQSSAERIYQVDLLGTALIIEAFREFMGPGSAMVVVASIAGMVAGLGAEDEEFFATAESGELLSRVSAEVPSTKAYAVSKRANVLRVKAATESFGRRGARINAVSPGTIMTPMLKQELEDKVNGPVTKYMTERGPLGRVGTAQDVAEVVAFLCGGGASFVTGTEIVVDGGIMAGGTSMVERAREHGKKGKGREGEESGK